jgi:iron complex outermembrane receptor protein
MNRARGVVGRASWTAGLLGLSAAVQAQTVALNNLEDLSLEDLAKVQVTSVTGRPQSLQRAAASIFVISADDIRRSTARSLPEALRLAPNLQVARLNSGNWAISARGFNNSIGNKLLVLIDGRTVYSPLFSGVFWDAQDVVLEDVERIEVISGPGATLWGANAVNGVINVIMRPAAATTGALVSAVGDKTEGKVTARYGGTIDERTTYRAYATRTERDNTYLANGTDRRDDSETNRVGFRVDWNGGRDQATIQGDAYDGGGDGATNNSAKVSGGNVLARWRRDLDDGSNWQIQAYLDNARHHDDVLFRDTTDTVDLSFNHSPTLSPNHQVLWGAGYREARSETDPTAFVTFDPPVKRLRWSNLFLQDEIRIAAPLKVTVGAKVETNVYTGAEFLPSLRATYELTESDLLWASASRAVRSPARLDRDFNLSVGGTPLIQGGPDFQSEVAKVFELGYRGHRLPGVSYSVTAFHHDYDRLRAGRSAPTQIENLAWGQVWGVEGWGTVDVTKGWRLSAGWLELRKSLEADPAAGAGSVANLGNDPRRQWSLRSNLDISSAVQLDAVVRYVAALPEPYVPSYTALDARLGWRISNGLEASAYLQNLGADGHTEFGPTEASRLERVWGVRLEWSLP